MRPNSQAESGFVGDESASTFCAVSHQKPVGIGHGILGKRMHCGKVCVYETMRCARIHHCLCVLRSCWGLNPYRYLEGHVRRGGGFRIRLEVGSGTVRGCENLK